jgi:hypothetical protein
MKIITTPIKYPELKPGDLFSNLPSQWAEDYKSHGEALFLGSEIRVFIRTDIVIDKDPYQGHDVFKITIIKE